MEAEASYSAIGTSWVRKSLKCFAAAVIVFLTGICVGTLAQAQILGTAQLNIERRGHTATLLDDGKVLIVGGDNQSGMISQAEIFDPASQAVSLSAASIVARTDHTATKLSDGRVIIIGGQGQNGSLTSTEIYDPMTASFTSGPSLTTPRSGHTSTILADGKILIAGGDATGSAEIYDPATQKFSLIAGSMQTVRKFHSAILTSAGQVLIVGGVNAQNAVLNTAEVYDPASQSFYMPPTDMQAPRALATLKLLADGKVQIIGGDAASTMEVFDPELGWFNALALLPPTVDSLDVTLSTQSRAALISPTISQDSFLQGVLTADDLALLDRADHSITELPTQNKALVAGGINSSGQILNSATLVSSSSASITTDKTDYAPGSIVTITGKGYQLNELVTIRLHETPDVYTDPIYEVQADAQGSFTAMQFSPQTIDIGRTFTLTAVGQTSGYTAQTVFTDSATVTINAVSGFPKTVTADASGNVTLSVGYNFTLGIGNASSGANYTVYLKNGGTTVTLVTSLVCNIAGTYSGSASMLLSGAATAQQTWDLHVDTSKGSCGGTGSFANSSSNSWVVVNAPVGAKVGSVTVGPQSGALTYGTAGSATYLVTVIRNSAGAFNADLSITSVLPIGVTASFSPATVTFASADTSKTSTLTISSSTSTPAGATDFTAKATNSVSATDLATGNGTLTVQKANQAALTLNTTTPLTYNQSETMSVTGGSTGGAVTYNLVSGSCTISGDQLKADSGTGSCSVTATMAGNDNYNPVTSSPANVVNLQKANALVTLSGLGTYIYDGSQKVVTATTNPNGLTVNITYAASLSSPTSTPPTDVGTYTVVGTISDLNYQGSATDILIISAWTAKGFYQPVDMPTTNGIVWNSVKGGSTVPLKFEIFAGSTELTNTSAVAQLQAQGVRCINGVESAIAPDDLTATGGTSLRYDTTGGQFIFNWQTAKSANACYKVTMTAKDGSSLSAYFKTK